LLLEADRDTGEKNQCRSMWTESLQATKNNNK
jgi:hypothetical protein